jgi:hypothetical protein
MTDGFRLEMEPWDETLDITRDAPDVEWVVGFDRQYRGSFASLVGWEAAELRGLYLWPNLTNSTSN